MENSQKPTRHQRDRFPVTVLTALQIRCSEDKNKYYTCYICALSKYSQQVNNVCSSLHKLSVRQKAICFH